MKGQPKWRRKKKQPQHKKSKKNFFMLFGKPKKPHNIIFCINIQHVLKLCSWWMHQNAIKFFSSLFFDHWRPPNKKTEEKITRLVFNLWWWWCESKWNEGETKHVESIDFLDWIEVGSITASANFRLIEDALSLVVDNFGLCMWDKPCT